MTESEEFRKFCRELLNWIEEGTPEHRTFVKHDGICGNYVLWGGDEEYLVFLFEEEGLGIAYPFNSEVPGSYWRERVENRLWENPKRLAWLRKHAEDPEWMSDTNYLLSVIAEIRLKTGVGAKPMLSELADAICAMMRSHQKETGK